MAVPARGMPRDLLVRRLDTLAGIEHPDLVRVVTISPSGGNQMDVRLDRPDAADLPTLLASRGPLTAAEASGMVASVARALAALHSEGLVHGHVAPTDILFTPGGATLLRPRLGLPVGAADEEPVEDIPSLARLAQSVLRTGPIGADGKPTSLRGADQALRAELARACADDPREIPEAGTLAARVHDAVAPVPVRLPDPNVLAEAARTGPIQVLGPAAGGRVLRRADLDPRWDADPSATDEPPSRRRRTGFLVGVTAVGLALGVGAGALASMDESPFAQLAEASTTGSHETRQPHTAQQLGADMNAITNRGDPAAAAGELTRLRMLLFTGTPVEVSDIDLPGSPAHATDAALLNRVFDWGTQVSGADVTIAAADVVSDDEGEGVGGPAARDATVGADLDAATVRVEYQIGAYVQVSDAGVIEVPPSETRAAMLSMIWTDDGWRVTRVA